ncbi:histidine phosphatase family protein [Candidatus Gottesmanbacteria bacterium]|nr:histidine phosphatase family protein [Candidatus Gottesmanbacteria bacterium]
MVTSFLFIRHGQTAWNQVHRMQGQTDIPLNASGKMQAEQIADLLRTYPIHVFYTSPLQRTHETARTIHAYHQTIPMYIHHTLKERSFGVIEGKTYDEIADQFPALAFDRSWHHPYFQIPGGERLIDVYMRGEQFLQEVIEKEQGKTVAVIAHGVIIRCMISALLKWPLTNNYFYELNNTSVTMIRVPTTGEPELQMINYTAHLK